jgi:hypothetical protein
LIFIIYWFVANSVPKVYNYWAIFFVEIFVLIFWLCTFALLSEKVAKVVQYDAWATGFSSGGKTGGSTYCYAGYCIHYKRSLVKRDIAGAVDALYAVLGLSILNL